MDIMGREVGGKIVRGGGEGSEGRASRVVQVK